MKQFSVYFVSRFGLYCNPRGNLIGESNSLAFAKRMARKAIKKTSCSMVTVYDSKQGAVFVPTFGDDGRHQSVYNIESYRGFYPK